MSEVASLDKKRKMNLYFSAGMMLGGGCGDQLAKWAVHGRPELDMYG